MANMDLNPQMSQYLSRCFLDTLSPMPETRRLAESALADAADMPNFALSVLRIVAELTVDEQIRQAAAVALKNHLKSRWASTSLEGSDASDSDTAVKAIPGAVKQQTIALIVSSMVNSSPRIQTQLNEALSVIGKHDFPILWATLLPEVADSLDRLSQGNDYALVNGILVSVTSLFEKFRDEFKTNESLLELKYCLDNFAKQLLVLFQRTAGLLDQASVSVPANTDVLKLYLESQKLCCEIFYSLNFQDMPEFFVNHMSKWMVEFEKYLTVKYSALEDTGDDGLTVADELRAAVCVNVNLYLGKEEERFKVYFSGIVEAVWGLLLLASSSPSREKVTVTAIKFLTTVSTSRHHSFFSRDDVLQQIVHCVVIPNMMLREEEEELFDMNYEEFISRDMEGSNMVTRRRVACELLEGLAVHFKEEVTRKVSDEIQGCLDYFSSNPDANWKHKDCAIHLAASLVTGKPGSYSNTNLVCVENLFQSVIIPELQSQNVNDSPMLKACALKFFTMIRNQMPKPVALLLLPDVVRFLESESNVVHSYAATCIEKHLLVKDDSRPRYTSEDIAPFLQPLIANLFTALQKPKSEENRYVMKCIMRVFCVADISHDFALSCTRELIMILGKVCKDPKSQVFNSCVFESVAALIRRDSLRYFTSALEVDLLPSIEPILNQDISKLLPHALHLLAQLVERTLAFNNYVHIFDIILSPDLWKKSANVSALVHLLQAFIRVSSPQMMVQQGKLENIIGIVSGLVSVSSSGEQGFYVLSTVFENICYDAIQPHLNEIWVILFNKLYGNCTLKFVENLVILMSLFLVDYDAEKLVDSVNAVRNDLFCSFLEEFWIPSLERITGFIEFKLTTVASTILICEYPKIWESGLGGKLLNSIVALISRCEQEIAVEDELKVPDFREASFARLFKEEDVPLKEVEDPKLFFVISVSRLCAATPGMYTPTRTTSHFLSLD